jgi:hypothetical protein
VAAFHSDTDRKSHFADERPQFGLLQGQPFALCVEPAVLRVELRLKAREVFCGSPSVDGDESSAKLAVSRTQ